MLQNKHGRVEQLISIFEFCVIWKVALFPQLCITRFRPERWLTGWKSHHCQLYKFYFKLKFKLEQKKEYQHTTISNSWMRQQYNQTRIWNDAMMKSESVFTFWFWFYRIGNLKNWFWIIEAAWAIIYIFILLSKKNVPETDYLFIYIKMRRVKSLRLWFLHSVAPTTDQINLQ